MVGQQRCQIKARKDVQRAAEFAAKCRVVRAAQARASRAARKRKKERMEAAAAVKTLTLFSFRNPVMEDDESAEPILVPFKPRTGERRVNSKPS